MPSQFVSTKWLVLFFWCMDWNEKEIAEVSSSMFSSPLFFETTMPKAGKIKTEEFNRIVLKKHKYALHDKILISSGKNKPFVGELLTVEGSKADSKNITLTVKWYYRPEDMKGGRQDHHGKDELFESTRFTSRP